MDGSPVPVGPPVRNPGESSGWESWSDFEFMAISRRRDHPSHDVLLDEVANIVGHTHFTILDVGVLSTVTLDRLQARRFDCDGYVGLDVSAPIINNARARHPDVRWIQASVEALPFADATFDVVLARHVLEHLSSPDAAIDEITRVSRYAALLCFFLPPGDKEDFRRDVYANGFIFHNTWSRERLLGRLHDRFSSVRSLGVDDAYRRNEIFVLTSKLDAITGRQR